MSDSFETARLARYAMFNNMAFSDVVVTADRLLANAVDGTVTTRQIAAALGIGDSVVRPVMERLVGAGMLDELPRTGVSNGRRLFHRRNEGRWTPMLALIQATGATTAAGTPKGRQRRQRTD